MSKTWLYVLISVVVSAILTALITYFLVVNSISADVSTASSNLSQADLNKDGRADEKDFASFMVCWNKYNKEASIDGCTSCDITSDSVINAVDFAYFASAWRRSGKLISIDLDGDGGLNDLDYGVLKDCWNKYNQTKQISSLCTKADIDSSGTINAIDSAVFAQMWRYGGMRRVGDLDGNKKVDKSDNNKFKSCWDQYNRERKVGSVCKNSDLNLDEKIDAIDYNKFVTSWRVYNN